MKIKKEFIPSVIVISLVCLNIPLAVILSIYYPNLIEDVMVALATIQCILLGITILYGHLLNQKKERKNYKVCEGVIEGNKFKFHISDWIKTPIVSYEVNGKKYETALNIGINGIFDFLLKGRKIKVYYDKNNPEYATVTNILPTLVGIVFVVVGMFLLINIVF